MSRQYNFTFTVARFSAEIQTFNEPCRARRLSRLPSQLHNGTQQRRDRKTNSMLGLTLAEKQAPPSERAKVILKVLLIV